MTDKQDDLKPGEGLKREFGAWADDARLVDDYLEWCRQRRKVGRNEIDPLDGVIGTCADGPDIRLAKQHDDILYGPVRHPEADR